MRRIGRFFLYMFASVGALVTLAFVSVIVLAVTYEKAAPELPEQIFLRLDLDRGISDSRSDDPWRQLRGDKTVHLYDVVDTLATAEKDDRVVGLVIRLGATRIGLVHAQELRQSIEAFRSRGKFAMAFAQTFGGLGNGTTEYYLASSVDEIWVRPSGQLSLLGIGLETPFLKDALDKVGVQAEFEQRHEFKSAIETLTRDAMSAPARASLLQVVIAWFDRIVADIAKDRKISPETLRQLVDRSPLLVEEAKNAQLVDRLGYWDEFTDAVRARAGKEAKGLKFSAYAAHVESPGPDGTDVALIYGVGPIQSGDADISPWDSDVFSAASVARAIDDAVKDQAIKAILLRIDSPGGSYIGSDTVRRAVLRARKKGKPVISSMGSYGASGGYFVAMGADKIVAQPGTMTGSIGIFGGKLVTADLWEKLGINWNRLNVGAHAGMWSQIFPFSPTAAARHRAVIDFVYDDFARKVAEDRRLSDDEVDAVARGRIWSGTGARRVGLVDALGGYATAASLVREALKLDAEAPINFVVLPEPLSPLDRVREALNDGVPLMQILVSQFSEARPDTMAAVGRYLEPVFGDTSVLRPPAGVLQLPPLRLAP